MFYYGLSIMPSIAGLSEPVGAGAANEQHAAGGKFHRETSEATYTKDEVLALAQYLNMIGGSAEEQQRLRVERYQRDLHGLRHQLARRPCGQQLSCPPEGPRQMPGSFFVPVRHDGWFRSKHSRK